MAYDFSRDPTLTDPDFESALFANASEFLIESPQPAPASLPPASAAKRKHPSALDHERQISEDSSATSALARSTSQTSSAQSTTFGAVAFAASASPSSSHEYKMEGGDSPEFKNEPFFMDMNDNGYLDSAGMPVGEQAMNDLSLNALDNNGNNLDYAPHSNPLPDSLFADAKSDHLATAFRGPGQRGPNPHTNGVGDSSFAASPQLTVQPEKMFQLGGSREGSPTSVGGLMNSHENSPAPFSTGSPMPSNPAPDGFTTAPTTNYSNAGLAFDRRSGTHQRQQPSLSSNSAAAPLHAASKWPCRLTVDQTPEKSRVETQIPIKLTLHDCPAGVTKLHLPSHTISKPKFQAKPSQQATEDTLKLSTMLVCASAMTKEGLLELAMQRALSDEVPVRKEETGAANDNNDPDKPLNGGPVTICSGCIVRERKRAARKKTKKVDEEEEWAKDEAKRVIVFNCPEIRDWCVPGTKDVAVKDHDSASSVLYVNAPMRIACYCRHQNEKTGFQVIFTLKTASGTVVAQAISNSIMITDDHKQPIQAPGQATALGFASGALGQLPHNALFPQAYQMMPTFQHNMPFRTSFSTNDLTRFQGQQFAQMNQGMAFHRGLQNPPPRSQTSTAAPTPRNLSRPASPTDPSGHSTKKRRSGGPSKVPSGLTMTRLDTQQSPSAGNSATPMTATNPSTAYSFTSPTATHFSNFDGYPPLPPQSGGLSSSQYPSVPSTPHYGSPAPGDTAEQYQYFSAPTSQHASRAPSPSPALRMPSATSFQQQNQVPQAAARALESLPPGLNIQRPPLIQRIIPSHGSRNGGEEVTILGTGFFQSLEVMFGDVPATKTTFWGDTSLVCEVPSSGQIGAVDVLFRHQHRSAPQVCREIQGLMPGQIVKYTYTPTEEDKNHARLQQLSANIMQAPQHGGIDPTQLNQNMLGGVLQSPNSFSNYMGTDQISRMQPR